MGKGGSAAALMVMMLACDSGPKPVAVASVRVTPSSASIIVGNALQLSAAALDANGNTLAGRTITWGADKSTVLSVGPAGLVTAIAPGTALVTATTDGTAGTAALTVIPVPVASVRVTPSDPSVVVGATVRLFAEARDSIGGGLLGREIAWSSGNAAIATVTSAGDVTGVSPGTTSIVAASEGTSGAVTLVVLSPNAAPVVNAIAPSALVPWSIATITGTGFGTGDPPVVTIGGAPARVLTVTSTQLTVTVPCLRAGDAEVRVAVGALAGARSHPVTTQRRTLAVGQSLILTSSGEAACNELVLGGGASRYLLAAFSGATSQSTLVDMELAGNTPVAGTVARLVEAAPRAPAEPVMRDAQYVHDSVHFRFMERERALYAQLRTTAFRREAQAASRASAPLPSLGDTRSLFYTFTGGCGDTTRVMRSRAIYIGTRAVIWEDSANVLQSATDPALAGYYRKIGVIFDQEQYDAVRRNFGDPLLRDAVTDGDARVHMVFTQRLNSSGAAAYVTSCDQFPGIQARGSNFGEYFYGGVPINAGSNLNSFNFPDGWFYFMARTVVHEVKHIASMASRVANNASRFEESWLEEGTARHAEEMWVRESLHTVPWKGNTGWGSATTASVYCDFHPADATCGAADTLRRPSYGMRRHFNEIRDKLLQPWNWSPYGDGTGQTGSVFYQTTWSLVRYAIDRFGASDAAFLGTLMNSSGSSGVANLSAVAGVSMDRLIGGWGLALAADDYPGLASVDADAKFATWNLRDIYAGLNAAPAWSARWATPYPVQPVPLTFGSFVARQPGVRGGSHAYFELSGTASGTQLVDLRGIGGAPPSQNVRLAILRLQ